MDWPLMYSELTPAEREEKENQAREEAIKYLSGFISTEEARLYKLEIEKYPEYKINNHFMIGVDIRNIIRGKYEWDDHVLDAEWFRVFEGAVDLVLKNE